MCTWGKCFEWYMPLNVHKMPFLEEPGGMLGKTYPRPPDAGAPIRHEEVCDKIQS